jgi:hypothetical protein
VELHDGHCVQNHLPDPESKGEEEHKEAALPNVSRLDKLIFHHCLQHYIFACCRARALICVKGRANRIVLYFAFMRGNENAMHAAQARQFGRSLPFWPDRKIEAFRFQGISRLENRGNFAGEIW